jgi:hypothetical protein
MILSYFSSQDWQSWDVEHRPVIPEGMPVLIDDDLLFEDGPAAPRPASVVNQWLRLLPASGAPAPSSWENYARAVKEWTEFLVEHGIGLFDARDRLKAGLSRYAEHRAAGPMQARFAATTWAQHMSILSLFYRWRWRRGSRRRSRSPIGRRGRSSPAPAVTSGRTWRCAAPRNRT